jgi:glutaredoxin
MDKQRRDADRLAQILADAEVPFEVKSLENDPAAQAAVRRDSKGHRLPVVFVAGDAIGGREQLTNLGRAGIRTLVFG